MSKFQPKVKKPVNAPLRAFAKLKKTTLKEAQALLTGGAPGKVIARKLNLDPRLVSEIRRRLAKGLEDPPSQVAEEEVEAALAVTYRNLLRDIIPARARVKVLREALQSSNLQVRLRALERIDALEGVGKDKVDDRPAPLFVISANEEPDLRRKDYRDTDTTVDLWIENWRVHNPEDGTVQVVCNLGSLDEESTQVLLRAIHGGVPLGLRPKAVTDGT